MHGKSAHAAAPETGHDALAGDDRRPRGALRGAQGLCRRASRSIPASAIPNLTVGLISGGINTNVVPDKVTIRLDRRMIAGGGPGAGGGASAPGHRRERRATCPASAVEIERVLLASPLRQLPGAEVLIEPLRRYGAEILGEAPKVEGVPLYTDARLYAEAGIPTVSYGAGPRSFLEANGHRADERLKLSDLDRRDAGRGAQRSRKSSRR